MMGGALDCDASPGHGASFWVDIPLERTTAPVAVADSQVGPAIDRLLRILAADDHPTNRRILQLMLEGQSDLVCVENGQEALDRLAQGPNFDLVLMDMQMPVMDGLTAVRRIRLLEASTGAARVPIIMLTANAMPEHIAEAEACGADLHLGKPFTAEALFAAIGEAFAATERYEAAA